MSRIVAVVVMAIIACSATWATDLTMDFTVNPTLPSSQGFNYVSQTGTPEASVFSVSDGLLHWNTFGTGIISFYEIPNGFDATSNLFLEIRARVYAGTANGAVNIEIHDGFRLLTFNIRDGAIFLPDGDMPFTTTDGFHTYKMVSNAMAHTYSFYVDGILLRTGTEEVWPYPTPLPPLFSFGDGTSEDGRADIAYIHYTNAPSDITPPISSNVVVSPNPLAVNTSSALSATVDDSTTGGSNITSAYFSIGGGATYQLSLNPSTAVTTQASATLAPFAESNVYNVCVQGTDSAGNIGANTCILLPVYDATCVLPTAGTAIGAVSWNNFAAPGPNDIVWVNAHLGSPSGISTSTLTTVGFNGVTFVLNGATYALPDGFLIFDPSAPIAPTTSFKATSGPHGTWITTLNPSHLSDEIFFDGNAIPIDTNILSGGHATLSYTTYSSDYNLKFSWQWSAAAYTTWPGNNQAQILSYHQSDHAGTPENTQVRQSLIPGPRGGAGSNYTGGWSGAGKGTCPGAK